MTKKIMKVDEDLRLIFEQASNVLSEKIGIRVPYTKVMELVAEDLEMSDFVKRVGESMIKAPRTKRKKTLIEMDLL